MNQLLPHDITTLRDLPFTIFDAIRSALVFLSFEELPTEERPPRAIWHRGDRLTEWFDDVRVNRARDSDPGQHLDDPVSNDAAADLVVG